MELALLNRLGDWNPQLLRELKGRLKRRNLLIAAAISLAGQFFLFQSFQTQIPVPPLDGGYIPIIQHQLCTGNLLEGKVKHYECLLDAAGNFIINWQLWWLNLFVMLSFIGISALLVAGSYLLIADLAKEDRQGSLNFIRFSPEPTDGILVGKMLGVPSLLYFVVALAIPLHLWSGLSAGIPLWQIFGFYGVAIACCIFFFSASLLYGLVTSVLAGFQAWLGSGILLGLLNLIRIQIINQPITTPVGWLRVFIPFDFIPNLSRSSFLNYQEQKLEQLQWFSLPIGSNLGLVFCLAIVNYFIWNYWIWQGLNRCFRISNTTILSKSQSYLLTAWFSLSTLGFCFVGTANQSSVYWFKDVFSWLYLCNIGLFFFLIASLSPQRQALQDWARYRREKKFPRQRFWNSSLARELIWGEKSPAVLAIALNLVIAILPITLFTVSLQSDFATKSNAFLSLALMVVLMAVYAIVYQIMLFGKTQNPQIWAIGTISAMVVLPPLMLVLLSIKPESNAGFLWLFSIAAPLVPLYSLGSELSIMAVILGIICQCGILASLNLQLRQQLRKSGESQTKAILSGGSLAGGRNQ